MLWLINKAVEQNLTCAGISYASRRTLLSQKPSKLAIMSNYFLLMEKRGPLAKKKRHKVFPMKCGYGIPFHKFDQVYLNYI